MKKVLTVVILVAFLAVLFSACAGQDTATTPEAEVTASASAAEDEVATADSAAEDEAAAVSSEHPIKAPEDAKFVYCCLVESNTAYAEMTKKAREVCDELGVNLTVTDAQYKSDLQLKNVENALQSGADAIIFNEVTPDYLVPYMEEAMEKGIYTIELEGPMDEFPDSCNASFYSDNKEIGKKIGAMAVEWVLENKTDKSTPIKVCDIANLTNIVGKYRSEGAKEYITETLTAEGYEVVFGSAYSTDTLNIEDGVNGGETILQSDPDVSVITVTADSLAIGADQALRAAGVEKGQVGIFGCDCVSEVYESLKNNDTLIEGSVYQDLVSVSEKMMNLMYETVCEGKHWDESIVEMYPQYKVTSDNVAEVAQFFGE